LESGILFHLIEKLSKPGVYLRHPFLAAGVSLITGAPLLVLSAVSWAGFFRDRNWIVLVPAIGFGVLGALCLVPLFLLIRYSSQTKNARETEQ
jgi:hypothetical protein